jgi:hypothetical protein
VTSGGTVFIFNGDVSFVGFNISQPNIFYYKARQDFSINDFRAQLFDKQGISVGNLVIELEKSIDTNNANFSSILSTPISFDFATDLDYAEDVALIDSLQNSIFTDDVLRVKVTNIPSGFSGNILLSIGAQ